MTSSRQEFTPGYPVDIRRPERVQRLQRSYFGDFEFMAGRVVARLTGDRVVLQDDGSERAMPDVRIERADGRSGYLEVWTDTDEASAAMQAELYERGRGVPLIWAAPSLRRVWSVTVSGATDFRRLERDLPSVLLAMEDAGETDETVRVVVEQASRQVPYMGELLRLGVVHVSSRPPRVDEAGMIRIHPDGITGPGELSWEPVLRWVGEILASPRLDGHRRKLAAQQSDERHLFLGVTVSSPGAVYFALIDHPGVPSVAPTLPDGITHLWIMEWRGERCLIWFPDRGWQDASRHWATA